ncbi:hypothetical protein AB1Y20_022670 [Prymnesium parvum]|uniref:gamma-glutamylcyclotransferase n=1 Tax=Prymnesium parvum TaxID=97485 RepID=A0AB34JGY6_PRYPA
MLLAAPLLLLAAAPLLAVGSNAPVRSLTTGASPSRAPDTSTRPLPPSVMRGGHVEYFAFGSNLLQSKVEGRTGFPVLAKERAVVTDHRLAFNMRAFPPLEPAMASLEPCAGESCEGVLYTLSREAYEQLWRSEGGAARRPAYEEVVVLARCRRGAVPALSLRAAPAARLRRDAPPSRRYKDLLVRGAREARLSAAYLERLEAVRAVRPSPAVAWLARAHGAVAVLCFRIGLRRLLAPLRCLLYFLMYSGQSRAASIASECLTACALLPTALIGVCIRALFTAVGKEAYLTFGPPPSANQSNKKAAEGAA